MTIRKEITCMLLAILALGAVLNYFAMGMVLDPVFQKLERQNALKDMNRFVGAMEGEIKHLDTLNNDWAVWDDTYSFINDRNQEYILSNLGTVSFFDNKLNLIYLINTRGEVVWGKAYDLETEQPIEIKDFPADIFPDHHPLLGLEGIEDSHTGVFISAAGPMFVSARPIITSEMKGPARGTLIMGKLISAEYLESLAKQTRTNVQIWVEGKGRYAREYQQSIDELNSSGVLVTEAGEETLNVFSLYKDLTGKNSLMLMLTVDREITAAGRKTSLFVNLSIVVIGVFVMAFFLVLLQIRIVAPIRKLIGVIIELGKNDDLYSEMDIGGCEEIQTMAREFNDMVGKLNLARYKMINQSYFSGMAEVTADLIHNIRNSLNPIVTDVFLLREKCNHMPLESMRKSVDELTGEDPLDPGRRKKLAEFLGQSMEHIEKIRNEVDHKLGNMEKQSDITRKFLDGIEDFAHQGFYIEKFNIHEVIKDVSGFFENKFPKTDFTATIENVGVIKSHKSALIQIMVNLLQNAGESVTAVADGKGGKVELICNRSSFDGHEMVHISVADDGQGIAADDIGHVFERGFSTKNKKISGIGLHWCANAVKSLGGRLSVESEGAGHGACFHLLIPLEPEF